jgi:hypothetical protein
VVDPEVFLERNPGYLFVVFRHYDCNCNYGKSSKKSGPLEIPENSDQQALKPQESIWIWSADICKQLNTLVKDLPQAEERFPKFTSDMEDEIEAPYIFYYHNREFFSKAREKLVADDGMGLLLDYIAQSVEGTYKEVDDLLGLNLLTADIIQYLFSPTTTIVSSNKKDRSHSAYNQCGKCQISPDANGYSGSISLPVESWSYDGKFTKSSTKLVVSFHIDEPDSYSALPKTPTMKIQELSAYPI